MGQSVGSLSLFGFSVLGGVVVGCGVWLLFSFCDLFVVVFEVRWLLFVCGLLVGLYSLFYWLFFGLCYLVVCCLVCVLSLLLLLWLLRLFGRCWSLWVAVLRFH